MKGIPEGLDSTIALLDRAYPGGIPPEDLDGVMFLLYEFMSSRQLSMTISYFTGEDYMIHYNDVLRIGAGGCAETEIERVQMRLEPAGLAVWIAEED